MFVRPEQRDRIMPQQTQQQPAPAPDYLWEGILWFDRDVFSPEDISFSTRLRLCSVRIMFFLMD
jgi:hypothetical protein